MSQNRHHRRPRSQGGKSTKGNLIRVDERKHHAWHTLFDNYTPDRIVDIINNTWIDTRYNATFKGLGEG